MPDEEIVLNNRYQLLERIGGGGMAIVYKAQDLALGRIVAIKMLHENLTDDSGFLLRFQREAHAAANLTHPNIVTIHDIGQDGYRQYIVMEYIEGHTLKQLIRQYNDVGQFFPIDRLLDLTIQICGGIGYAHRANLVHCDVKPQNILVTQDERVKVADFGIARAMSQATQQQLSQVWGTPQYFSPEQAAGESPTPASDVYSIGVIMFEMLTGQLPFQAESHTGLALKHIQESPPAVSVYNPAVPKQLEQIVGKLLAKEASGRYRTAGQLGRILSTYRERGHQDTAHATGFATYASQTKTKMPGQKPVSEQRTQVYKRPSTTAANDRPVSTRLPDKSYGVSANSTPSTNQETDWTAVALGIIALIALLGLIPLWFAVYQAWAG